MSLIVTDQLGNRYNLSVDATTGSLETSPSTNPPSPSGANTITVTAIDIIQDAMKEIGVLASGEQASPGDSADVLRKLQRVIDTFNAREPYVYNVNFTRFTIVPNKQPITIGPDAADWSVNQRPIEIITAGLILNNTAPAQVETWIRVRDEQWWANQRVKNLTSTIPTDLYYSPDWLNGSIYLWPVPTDVNDVLIQSRLVLTEITTFNQAFNMPPGYWDAIVYSLAESIAPMFEREPSATLLRLKQAAIKAIMSNNIASPRGITADAGMPNVRTRGDFNYYTGTIPQ